MSFERHLFLVLVMAGLGFNSQSARADKWCFTHAESYYQQVFCQVKAAGKGKHLPPFYEFKKNNETTQALLLKRVAQQIGINLKMPGKQKIEMIENRRGPVRTKAQDGAYCTRDDNKIRCGDTTYRLVANRANSELASGALAAGNRMGLSVYGGSVTDANAITEYLLLNYQRYLNKMIAIGLGGATLSYGKFSYLFEDLRSKGVSFSGRFETMYSYLKKDKKTLSAPSRSSAPDELAIEDCDRLGNLMVCRLGRINWLFDRQ
ncbi:MAG: hypothetical protein V7708_11930 [Oceanicoccus sp.]